MKTLTLIAGLLPGLLVLSSGCTSTVAPHAAHATQASFSATADGMGNYQTSGVLGWRTNGLMVIDSTARNTINTLVVRGYGTNLPVPIWPTNFDYGLTAYTNNPVEPLALGRGHVSPPFTNPGGLWNADKLLQDAWPTMTTLSRQIRVKSPP